uniref:CPBP family intramembrane glutamic endopeptidase n=1 Tax=Wolbachia endosymbiont of Folsomia candida TaxID=169402 RepID=UPI001F257531|nr:CPBP family intramembrane glutamic endopeptidase [Wolbachia endosymbiont of Folsomia candida]
MAWSLPPEYVTLATFVPATVAILLTVYNKQKIRDLFKRSSLKNCLLGVIIPVVVFMLYSCMLLIITWLGFSFLNMKYTLEKVKDFSVARILFVLLVSFAIQIVCTLGEEIGWRSYLLKNLKSQIPNFYMRATVVGLIWGIWHIPLYKAIGPSFWEDGFTLPIICAFILAICAYSIMFTWLFEKDNSVWPVNIAHATSNFFTQTFPLLFTTISLPVPNHVSIIGHILIAVAYFIVAMGVIWFDKTRGRRLSNS